VQYFTASELCFSRKDRFLEHFTFNVFHTHKKQTSLGRRLRRHAQGFCRRLKKLFLGASFYASQYSELRQKA
jgi:hypothetical protein